MAIHELTLAVIESETDLYFLYMKDMEVSTFILSILALLPLLVISYAYGHIFSELQRQKKRLQTEQLPEEEANRLKKENKAANTLILIPGTLVITYIPTNSSGFCYRVFGRHFRTAYYQRHLELGHDSYPSRISM